MMSHISSCVAGTSAVRGWPSNRMSAVSQHRVIVICRICCTEVFSDGRDLIHKEVTKCIG